MIAEHELRAAILAPIGRDGPTIEELLRRAHISGCACANLPQFLGVMNAGAGAAIIAEEALTAEALTALKDFIHAQPPWSDLPFVVLSSNRPQAAIAAWREQMLSSLKNVSLLERPVQPITLISATRTALRARAHQYEVREHLARGKRSAEELERLVSDRTRDLKQANAALVREMKERAEIEARLRHAQKIEAVGQMTGGVAHDFNNLLMVISGGLNLLDKRPERRIEIIDSMNKAVARGARLTHQLLAFARRQDLKPQPIDLKRFFGEMAELLDRSLRGDVHVRTELADDAWPVFADPAELQLVILNLAVNARDAMPKGGDIVIRVENAPASNSSTGGREFVRISVIDTGTGMSPETVEKAFEPFFTTKDIGKGSGLGLAQVHGFASQSGGSVRISSKVGEGSTVSISLPRSARVPESGVSRADDAAARAARKSAGRVLIVEDDNEVAELVTEMFIELGYEVTRTASAAAALGALADGRMIDVVFSDVMMPGGMNGLELSREIRRRRPELQILLTSGFAEAVKRDAETEGIPLLPKPYQQRDLAAALRGLMRVHVGAPARRAMR